MRVQFNTYRQGIVEVGVMTKVFSRLGDGSVVHLTEAEVMKDIEEGTKDAAERAGLPTLSDEETRYLLELCSTNCSVSGIEKGREAIMTYDGGTNKPARLGIAIGRLQVLQVYERCFGADTTELSHPDYSYKAVKPILREEVPTMQQVQLMMVAPVFYGAMPNLGLYTKPDGPVDNPAELIPQGKIKEAQEAYEEIIQLVVQDLVFVASALYEAGADGINFDTVGGSGDPDFKAALLATEMLKKKYPEICIEVGMAGEFVLGMHGGITHNGVRLAGLYPHEQVKVAQEAGVTIFGPDINTVTRKSVPWNLSRAITFVKACVEAANIPVHANMGMGVGAMPVCIAPPVDMASLTAKAMIEICRLDGL
jgi:dimethylamine--corrinoid protein Co-methyltransferase